MRIRNRRLFYRPAQSNRYGEGCLQPERMSSTDGPIRSDRLGQGCVGNSRQRLRQRALCVIATKPPFEKRRKLHMPFRSSGITSPSTVPSFQTTAIGTGTVRQSQLLFVESTV